jgi:uncharacterized protein (DUF433 family)
MSTFATSQSQAVWKYLAPNPKSHYKQLFLKGTRIRAEAIFGWTVDGSEPATPEEVAAGYGLPLEAVLEAIAYCRSQPPEIEQDRRREAKRMKATGMANSSYTGHPQVLLAEAIAGRDQP